MTRRLEALGAIPYAASRQSAYGFLSFITSTKFSYFLTLLVCFAGLSWQLFFLTNDYLSYSIVSEVNMVKNRNVKPPAFSLCLPYVEMIDWTLMNWNFTQDEWVKIDQKDRDAMTMQLQKNWTIAKIFEETYNFNWMKLAGWLRKTDSYEIERNDMYMDIKKYLRDDFVCYRILHVDVSKDPGLYVLSHHNTYGPEPGGLLSFSLDREKIKQVTKASIFLHQVDVFPRGDADFPFNFISSNSSPIFENGSTYVGLTYTQMTLYYLSPPYKTSCSDYSTQDSPFETQEHCIESCMRLRTVKVFNESSFTATYTIARDIKMMSKVSVHMNRTKENEVDKLYYECLEVCPGIECHQIRFIPALVSNRDSNDITFFLQEPNGPETVIVFHPKLTAMDFYVQIMSVVGVWLGVAIIDAVVIVISVLLRTKKSNKTTIPRIRVQRQNYY